MYVLKGGGGGSGTIFFENWPLPLMVWVFWPVLVRVLAACTAPLPPLWVRFWGRGGTPPPFLNWEVQKNYVSEKLGTVGELCEGKIVKKWGRASPLIRSSPECHFAPKNSPSSPPYHGIWKRSPSLCSFSSFTVTFRGE